MRVFDSSVKNALYFGYRMISPVFDPIRMIRGIAYYPRYLRDLLVYGKLTGKNLATMHMFPQLHDRTGITPFDAHYYFQEIWAMKQILKRTPSRHVDIGSKYQFSGFLSLITKAEFVDIRPIETKLQNLTIVRGDILSLPYEDNSVPSMSTLHVLDHIGVGRYGDPLDADGVRKACREMVRVLAPKGYLYISLPIGKPRVCFNAHIIQSPLTIPRYCKGLKLVDFSVVDDDGEYHEQVDPKKYTKLHYGCGMYTLRKV